MYWLRPHTRQRANTFSNHRAVLRLDGTLFLLVQSHLICLHLIVWSNANLFSHIPSTHGVCLVFVLVKVHQHHIPHTKAISYVFPHTVILGKVRGTVSLLCLYYVVNCHNMTLHSYFLLAFNYLIFIFNQLCYCHISQWMWLSWLIYCYNLFV